MAANERPIDWVWWEIQAFESHYQQQHTIWGNIRERAREREGDKEVWERGWEVLYYLHPKLTESENADYVCAAAALQVPLMAISIHSETSKQEESSQTFTSSPLSTNNKQPEIINIEPLCYTNTQCNWLLL